MDTFSQLPLRDAELNQILIYWKDKTVVINVKTFTTTDKDTITCNLLFLGVNKIEIPHHAPWGESNVINTLEFKAGSYHIEMQSGDVLIFTAESYEFT
jgi:hypothetical protein